MLVIIFSHAINYHDYHIKISYENYQIIFWIPFDKFSYDWNISLEIIRS
jgi:hypothetical protein